ncbi:hypothetical protein ES332_A13G053500v1 [Gossypium tomentosum]|uniref:Uncharacterized protein n=1 Tax=Gossypium tomentosum TaxID=34277 RepID=A0A5D2MGC7_GOSTO|nr:hypothetical protein ES332_A13G053500v1 [Gossypium tomentosum]
MCSQNLQTPLMASSPVTSKQLKEHLKDKQEPFTLSIYLSERGYLVKCSSSNGRNGCCSSQMNLFKNLWNKKMVLVPTRVVKSKLHKLVSGNNGSLELSCCNNGNEDGFQSTDSSSRTCNVEPEKWERKCIEDKQLDLMSMLNKLSSDKVHHIITRQERPTCKNSIDLTENVKANNFVLANFPWKLLGRSLMERYTLIGFKEAKGSMITGPCTLQWRSNQQFGHQREPLMNLSAIKSMKNNDGTSVRTKHSYVYWFIGLKNLGNLMHACRKSIGFFYTFEEWDYCKLQRKIGFDIGDTIMDEIIEEAIDLLLQ